MWNYYRWIYYSFSSFNFDIHNLYKIIVNLTGKINCLADQNGVLEK